MAKKESFEQCMNLRDGWCQAHLGKRVPTFPGHPVVLACMVMDRYGSLSDAKADSAALKDGFIPGSGCAVWAALDLLEACQKLSLEEALKQSEHYWQNWEAQSNANAIAAQDGRAEATHLMPFLQEHVLNWLQGNRPPQYATCLKMAA